MEVKEKFSNSEISESGGKDIPQICKESGLSADYYNELFPIQLSLNHLDELEEDELPAPRSYRKRYPWAKKEHFNNPLLPVLDKLVGEMASQINNKTYTKESLKELIDKISDIIYKGRLPEDA
ncbi:MAG: hypothetical protein PHU56_00190 [Candidatus Pacebacteria bacterium]|nr:hypothetical protein [Candidatus Paceibacterota bacterium]